MLQTHKMPLPVLVLGWGNLSRGDDALGPLCVAALQGQFPDALSNSIEFLDDYQLQVEHTLDLLGRRQVLLIDACLDCAAPFEVRQPQPYPDHSYTSHALTPSALLQVFSDVHGQAAPPTTMLAIRGESFELGQAMSPAAQTNLAAALIWAQAWLESAILQEPVSA